MSDVQEIERYWFSVPAIFFRDHQSRGCVTSSGTREEYVWRRGKKVYRVGLNWDDVFDLYSDARYYDGDVDFDPSLGRSATSTRWTLRKQAAKHYPELFAAMNEYDEKWR